MTSGQPRPRSARPRCQSLDEALAWIAAEVTPVPPETVPLAELCGRVLAADVVAPADEPLQTRAARDGLAVRADDLVGASAYNPLSFRLSTDAEALGEAVRNAREELGVAEPASMSLLEVHNQA